MSYFTKEMKDGKFWLKMTVLPAIAGLLLLDILSNMFASPGYFNLWVVKIVGSLSVIGVIIYGIYLYIKPKVDKNEEEDQEFLEKMNEEKLRNMIAEDPEFQTFCYQCVHFNERFSACGKKIVNHMAKRARLSEKYTYCLHWLPTEEQEEANQV